MSTNVKLIGIMATVYIALNYLSIIIAGIVSLERLYSLSSKCELFAIAWRFLGRGLDLLVRSPKQEGPLLIPDSMFESADLVACISFVKFQYFESDSVFCLSVSQTFEPTKGYARNINYYNPPH
eukprot:6470685-Amphidinium_carterae.1